MIARENVEILHGNQVLIVGGGPVGLVFALILAHYEIPSVLIERSINPTPFPKMDLTLARTMEIFRSLGLHEAIRARGVSSQDCFTVRFSSGLGADNSLTSWDLPSVDDFRARIASDNDGTMPSEPWQRIPGNILESLLREECDKNPLVDTRYGWSTSGIVEGENWVDVEVNASAEHATRRNIRCRYVVGCDGANSFIRKSIGIKLDGDVPTSRMVEARLVHFRSRDTKLLNRQGPFWHTFFPSGLSDARKGSLGGAIISQDGKEIWTAHEYSMGTAPEPEPQSQKPSADQEDADQAARTAIRRVLGGVSEPLELEIDEILAQSTFRSTVALADAYASEHQRVFLAGDSCHQTVPSGGYGMNLGLADAWNLGWKLAGTIKGWAGANLLASYDIERRPVAELMLHWGKVHGMKLMGLPMAVKMDSAIINESSEAGQILRASIHEYIQTNDDHNKSFGVEMGYGYASSICVAGTDLDTPAPVFDNKCYTPTTFPGYRAPHVFLNDGSPIFDHYGLGFTLVMFTNAEVDIKLRYATLFFQTAAQHSKVPLKVVSAIGEDHAYQVWGASLVLVRPDGHVSWRGNGVESAAQASRIIRQASGHSL